MAVLSLLSKMKSSSALASYWLLLLLLLLSRFSRVRLCATPQTAAHQAPPSLGFSRQEHGVRCHFLLQYMKVKSESEVAQLCLTLSDPMDCSAPGSSVHGIFQARVLQWGAIVFSTYWLHHLAKSKSYRKTRLTLLRRLFSNHLLLIKPLPPPQTQTHTYTFSGC